MRVGFHVTARDLAWLDIIELHTRRLGLVTTPLSVLATAQRAIRGRALAAA